VNLASSASWPGAFAEAGVRFIEVCHAGWDQHQQLQSKLSANCAATDQPIAALLTDLKARGLLEDTLVMWGGEFGRTPMVAGPMAAITMPRAIPCGWLGVESGAD